VLLEYGGTLIGAAAHTANPSASLKPGSWCQFCPVRGKPCPELDKKAATTVREDFADMLEGSIEVTGGGMPANLPAPSDVVLMPDPEDIVQLSKAWLLIPYLDHFIKGVEGMVQRRVEFGDDFPWAKMVRKKSNRRYIDPDKMHTMAKDVAERLGIRPAEIYAPKKLKTPKQLEGVLGKQLIAEFAEKPEGGLTLAPMDDPREAVVVAPVIEDFSDVPELSEGETSASNPKAS
jgi:hypothetical protein